jgi:hypothetical protein
VIWMSTVGSEDLELSLGSMPGRVRLSRECSRWRWRSQMAVREAKVVVDVETE